MDAESSEGTLAGPASMSSRIRDLLALGATAREASEQLGCKVEFAYRVQARMRASQRRNTVPSLAKQVRELLSTGLLPAAVGNRLNCSADYVRKVRTRMRRSQPAAAPQRVTEAVSHGPVSAEDAVRMMVDAVQRLQHEVAALRTAVARIGEVVSDGLA